MTQSKNDSLSRQTAFLIFGRSYVSLCSFITFAVLSNILSVEDYGNYRQIWLVFNTLSPIFLFGIPATVAFFIPQLERNKQKAFVVQTGMVLAGLGLILSACLFCGAGIISGLFSNPDTEGLLRIFSVYPFFYFTLAIMDSLFVCLGRAKLAAGLTIMIATVQNVCIVASLWIYGSIELAFFVLNGGVFCVTLIAWLCVVKILQIRKIHIARELLKRQFSYGASLGLGASIGIISSAIDKWVISGSLPASDFAIYANGSFQVPFLAVITGSVMTVLTPVLVKAYADGNPKKVLELWHSAAYRVAIGIFPVFFLLFAFAPDLIVLCFSEKYRDSSLVFRLFLVHLPFRIVVYGSLLRAIGETKYIFYAAVQMLFLNFIVSITLVGPLGILGPCLGNLVSGTYLICYYVWAIVKKMEWKLNEFFPWQKLWRLFTVSGFCMLIVYVVARFISSSAYLSFKEIVIACLFHFSAYLVSLYFRDRNAINEIVGTLSCVIGPKKA